MVAIFGWLYGIIIFIICLTVLQYLCHFTLGLLISKLSNINYLFPTALFAINVWVLMIGQTKEQAWVSLSLVDERA